MVWQGRGFVVSGLLWRCYVPGHSGSLPWLDSRRQGRIGKKWQKDSRVLRHLIRKREGNSRDRKEIRKREGNSRSRKEIRKREMDSRGRKEIRKREGNSRGRKEIRKQVGSSWKQARKKAGLQKMGKPIKRNGQTQKQPAWDSRKQRWKVSGILRRLSRKRLPRIRNPIPAERPPGM